MKSYKALELHVHATIDDAMHKVTQEVWEMLEAEMLWDIPEMHKEAGDVIVNVLSVATELWCDVDIQRNVIKKKSQIELMIMLWDWNAKVQWYRNRYSRETVSLENLSALTWNFISEILKYTPEELSIESIIKRNIDKFSHRLDAYIPNLDLEDYIDTYSNFPKEGIEFKDISPILRSPRAFRYVCFELAKLCQWADRIAWLDARGFLFGPKIAEILGVPFEMIRKKWKLPGECVGTGYDLEYGSNNIEMQRQSVKSGEKIAVIDDLLATGWTMWAAIKLVELLGAEVMSVAFVIALDQGELANLPSRETLSDYSVDSLVSYE